MRVAYVLPKKDFFERGPRGSVAHAHGVVSGLVEAGFQAHAFGGKSIASYMPSGVEIKSSSREIFFTMLLFWKVYRENFDLVIVRHATSCSVFISIFCALCNVRGTRVVLEVNSLGFHNLKQKSLAAAKLVNFFETKLLAHTLCFYSVSSAMTQFLKSHIPEASVFTIPNGASGAEWELGHVENEKQRYVYLGSQQPYYDFEQLFAGFLRFAEDNSQVKLLVYGKERTDLQSQYGKHSQVEFRGVYSGSSVQKELSSRDILVLPRKFDWDVATSGGLSTKVFDYMSSGLLCIFPTTPELLDDLIDGQNCLVYSDAESLHRAFETSLHCDGTSMGAALRERFLLGFTWKSRMGRLIQDVQAFYDEKASK